MQAVSCFIVVEQHALVEGDGQFAAILQLLTLRNRSVLVGSVLQAPCQSPSRSYETGFSCLDPESIEPKNILLVDIEAVQAMQ